MRRTIYPVGHPDWLDCATDGELESWLDVYDHIAETTRRDGVRVRAMEIIGRIEGEIEARGRRREAAERALAERITFAAQGLDGVLHIVGRG